MSTIVLYFFAFLSYVSTNYLTPSLNLAYTLSTNLVVNSNMSSPVIIVGCYQDFLSSKNGWSTKVILVQYVNPSIMHPYFPNVCSQFYGINKG